MISLMIDPREFFDPPGRHAAAKARYMYSLVRYAHALKLSVTLSVYDPPDWFEDRVSTRRSSGHKLPLFGCDYNSEARA